MRMRVILISIVISDSISIQGGARAKGRVGC